MSRIITNINYMVTTYCNRTCPECTCNIPYIPSHQRKYFDLRYFLQSSRFFEGIERINVTGGEPTLHPDFDLIARNFKKIFNCEKLTLETNGFRFKWIKDWLSYFDELLITHYTKDSYDGSKDNSDDFEKYIKDLSTSTKVHIIDIVHTPRKNIGGGRICDRGLSETVSYANGLLYPCCVGYGVPNSKGIKLTKYWREDILEVPLPCKYCWFSN